jgi:hypothetical protein
VHDNGEGRAPRCERPGPAPTTTATNGPMSLPDRGDPRAIGELLACWIGCKVEEVDDLVAEARAKVAAIPDRRVLQSVIGELVVRVRALELDVLEIRKAAGL